MPSLMENLPFTVLECLREGIPLLASTTGGIPELIVPEQHARLLVPLRADLWAEALARVLSEGAERGRLAFDSEANRAAWLNWHWDCPSKMRRACFRFEGANGASQCVVHITTDRTCWRKRRVVTTTGLSQL